MTPKRCGLNAGEFHFMGTQNSVFDIGFDVVDELAEKEGLKVVELEN